MMQSASAVLRTIGRVLFLAVIGYLLVMIVSLLATALLAVCFGGLERGLEQLPKSRYFEPAVLGYFAAVCAAGIGFLAGGLLRITASKTDFYRAVWTKVLLVAAVAAAVATAGGIGVGFSGLSRELSTLLAFGTGIWVGIVFPLVVWVAPQFYRSPAEPE
jgi:hypothetical protein